MSLIIDDGEAARVAKRIADLTGEAVSEVVASALKERLDRLERARSEEAFLADIRAISREFQRQAGAHSLSSTNHGRLLYDEDGLPA